MNVGMEDERKVTTLLCLSRLHLFTLPLGCIRGERLDDNLPVRISRYI